MNSAKSAPQRIVSLCPSITEALFTIGAGGRVVGVTEYCVHPREKVENITKVGGSKVPDVDLIFSLHPDLVIMNEEENRVEDYKEIRRRGITVLNTFPKRVIDTAAMMRDVGRATGCEAESEKVASRVEEAVAAALEENTKKRRVKAVCFIWKSPFMTINRDTFLHDMMELAGFENIYGSRADRYPKITKEELQLARRDLGVEAALLPNEPFEFVGQHATEISAILQLPTKRALLCDGQYLTWYGSRTAAGIEYCKKLADRVRAFEPV